MKVIIFTEAGSNYGYGHLMRCLAIAQGFQEEKMESHFIIRGDGNYQKILDGFSYEIKEWLNADVLDLSLGKDNIAVVDSYYAPLDVLDKIYQNSNKTLFLDDYNRLPYPGGFVLNGVIGAEEIDYPENEMITYLLGPQYQPLRKEFWDVPEYVVRENIEQVMITFGGSDAANKTPEYLKKAVELFPDAQKKVVVGAGFSNVEKIQEMADEKTQMVYQPDASQMKQIMLESDLAISAAGQTIYELARVGVPTVAVKVAENQRNNLKYGYKIGFVVPESQIASCGSKEMRRIKSENGRKLFYNKIMYDLLSNMEIIYV